MLDKEGDLAVRLWKLSEASFESGSPWTLGQFLEAVLSETSEFIYDERDEELVGYLLYQQTLDEIEIYTIAVKNEWKNEGVGTGLMTNLFQLAEEREVVKIFLEVRESNIAAREFYRSVGFEEIGRRNKYYHSPVEDGLLLMKELSKV